MRGNSFGKLFSMTTFGESHGPAMGVIIDGVPAGLPFSLEELEALLERRAPGRLLGTTSRKEADRPEVLSGIFENKTLGTPIAVVVRNTNQKSADYEKLKDQYRPGHADETTILKYGLRDHRGGGRSSGRETLCRVIGGYFAGLILPEVYVRSYIKKLGPFEIEDVSKVNLASDFGPYGFPDESRREDLEKFLVNAKKSGESYGGTIVVVAENVPTGLGEPCFDKLKADLAHALLSIGACTSFSYGLGAEFANRSGNEVSKDRSHFGGIEGGISNGDPIKLEVTFKAPSTVGEKAKEGRHDPCVMPRALVVLESMVKSVLADHHLRQRAYQ